MVSLIGSGSLDQSVIMPPAMLTLKKNRRGGRTTPRGSELLRMQGPSRRSDILDRAADLIGRKGFAGMSARNIADELEFSKANFFYHIRSKEDLLYRSLSKT